MLYFYVAVAYTFTNLLLAVIIFLKSRRDIVPQFYVFLTAVLTCYGLIGYTLSYPLDETVRLRVLEPIAVFVYSLFPFFFMHFIVIFLRRYEILKSKLVVAAIYGVGLLIYTTVLFGYIPRTILLDKGFGTAGYIFYLTWMSIFFSIGIALLYSHVEYFASKRTKSKLLFTAFAVLLLVLPGPFTESVFLTIFHESVEVYFFSSSIALGVVVYFVFRHKVLVDTPYDALKSALTAVNDILLKMNDKFQIEMARGALQHLIGYGEQDLLQRSFLEIIDQKFDIEMYEYYVRQGKMKEAYIDLNVLCKSGDKLAMNFSFSPLFESDDVVGFVAVGRDVTERNRVDQLHSAVYRIAQAADSASTLGELFSGVHAIIQDVMPAGNFYIALYNEKENRLEFPYFVDEADVHPAPDAAGKGLTAYVMRTGKALLCDEKMTEELGRRGEAEIVGTPSSIWLGVPLIVDQKTIGVMAVQHYTNPSAYGEQDKQILEFVSSEVARVVDRKRAEEQIRLLAHAVESTTELISITDLQNRFTFVNKVFFDTYGYTAEEIIGSDSTLLDSPSNPPGLRREISESTRRGRWEGELLNRRKDGSEFPMFLSTSEIKDGTGKVIGYVGVARDLTERKKFEDQLRQAQKMESIGTLAGGVAHDFNNILSIILSYTSLLEQEKSQPEKLEHTLEVIKKAVHRGASIVRQILTFARKTDVTLESLGANEVITDIARMLAETFPESITFSLRLDPTLPAVVADRTQLQQALLNLCVNARDAMPNGGSLTVTTATVAQSALRERFPNAREESYVCIKVADTGLGMDELTRRHIFEPFFTTKEPGKGTGLGLAVVYGVVENHHGFIDVESSPGRGTTFSLFFPARTVDASVSTAAPAEKKEPVGGNETILFVEDEATLMNLVKSYLESRGYSVLAAGDGADAVELYKKHKDDIAVVVTDMGLPKMGGVDVFHRLREIRPAVKVILVSGYLDPALKNDMLTAGAKGFVQKPYALGDMLRKLREVIDLGKN